MTVVSLMPILLFQFHKGTIKTHRSYKDYDQYHKFQFHKGTIKTKANGNTRVTISVFQFHKGTIKT